MKRPKHIKPTDRRQIISTTRRTDRMPAETVQLVTAGETAMIYGVKLFSHDRPDDKSKGR